VRLLWRARCGIILAEFPMAGQTSGAVALFWGGFFVFSVG